MLTAGVSDGYAAYGLLVRAEPLWAADYAAWWDGILVSLSGQPCSGSSCCSTLILIVALAAMALVLVGQDCGGYTGCYGCWALRRQTRPSQASGQGVTSPLAVRALAGPAGYASWLGVLVVGAGTCWSVQLRCSCVSTMQEGAERQQLRWVAFAAALSALGVVAIGALVPLSSGNQLVLGVLTGACLALAAVGYGGGDPALPVCTTWTVSSVARWPMGC